MRYIRSFLAAVLTLSLVAGFGGLPMKKATSAAAKKNITIKNYDFTLKLPAGWKNNYVKKSGKNKNHRSYVTFSAKKIYKKTKDGFLFSIWRYQDNSYTQDLPSCELVGRWNGMNYVVAYSTDIQTMGATKAGIKQYRKLLAAVDQVVASILPVKKTGKSVYRAKGFSLKLPASWKGKYTVKRDKKDSYVAFYAKKCYNESKLGWLFTIAKYKDKAYKELPVYEVVGKWNGVSYVAIFPTDVQYEGVTKKAAKQYQTLNKSVKKVVRSIGR